MHSFNASFLIGVLRVRHKKPMRRGVLIQKVCRLLVLCGVGSASVLAQPIGRSTPCPVVASERIVSASNVQPATVRVPVLVMEGNDKVVTGLAQDRFILYQDQRRQTISHFAVEDSPASIGFIIDSSRSMTRKLPAAVEAVNAFMSSANPADEFFVVAFNSTPRLVVPMTRKPDDVRKGLSELSADGETALLDAVHLALSEMRLAHHRHRAMIIVSDGKDNSSQCTLHDMYGELNAQNIPMFAVNSTATSAVWPGRSSKGGLLLTEITRTTGGRLFQTTKPEDMSGISSIIATCLRSQYLLEYTPTGLDGSRRFHRIEVHLTSTDATTRLRAFWPAGYYSTGK